MDLILFLLIQWMIFFLVIAGCGLFCLRLLSPAGLKRDPGLIFLAFWLGLGYILLVLQTWHLFLPVNIKAVVLILIWAVIGWVFYFRAVPRADPQAAHGSLPGHSTGVLLIVVAVTGIMIWCAHMSLAPVMLYDTALYHLQTVQWNRLYSIVPGLGNLHVRFGLQDSFFLLCALIESVPGNFLRSTHQVNGLLFSAALSQIAITMVNGWRGGRFADRGGLFLALMFAIVLSQVKPAMLATLSPDGLVFLLECVICFYLLCGIDRSRADSAKCAVDFLVIVVLCAAGFTIKPSLWIFSMAALAVACFAILPKITEFGQRMRMVWVAGLSVACGLGGCLLSQVILTGYPFFPAVLFPAPLVWRVPESTALDMLYFLQSWARKPGVHWSQVLENWQWFGPWLQRHLRFPITLLLPLGVASVGVLLSIVILVLRGGRNYRGGIPLLLVPPGLGVVSWFFSAPDIRFAGSLFWIIAFLGWFWVCELMGEALALSKAAVGIVIVVLILCFVPAVQEVAATVQNDGYRGLDVRPSSARFLKVKSRHGVEVNYPVKSDQCWDAPLPCAPYPPKDLGMIRPGHLGGGFTSQEPTKILLPKDSRLKWYTDYMQ